MKIWPADAAAAAAAGGGGGAGPLVGADIVIPSELSEAVVTIETTAGL